MRKEEDDGDKNEKKITEEKKNTRIKDKKKGTKKKEKRRESIRMKTALFQERFYSLCHILCNFKHFEKKRTFGNQKFQCSHKIKLGLIK